VGEDCILKNRGYKPLPQLKANFFESKTNQAVGCTEGDLRMATNYIKTSQLEIGYEIRGEGQPVILLHGFPDDIRAWDAVAEGVAKFAKVYTPYLRGFGETKFLDTKTVRSGQTGALALDILEFANALGIERFGLVGHDWGANAAQAIAAIHPVRVSFLVSLAPYSLTWDDYQEGPPNYAQIRALWYQNFLNQEWAADILRHDAKGFSRYLWETWSPGWKFADADFETTARSFANPDFVPVVLNAYRAAFGEVEQDPRSAQIEAQLNQRPAIGVPTTVLLGKEDGISIFEPFQLEQTRDFTGKYEARAIEGVGHFLHREQPQVVIDAIRAALKNL
jgi:pimeloyl-ACP methyl ester carboxylesterase